jgi:hypothetical protein
VVKARKSWASGHAELERQVEQQEREIKRQVREAKVRAGFRELVDLHWASSQVADAAYSLLSDARTSLDGLGRCLGEARARRDALELDLRRTRESARRGVLEQELRLVRDLRAQVFADQDVVKAERDAMLARVQGLNRQTCALADAIGTRCGERGRDWYARRAQRRLARAGAPLCHQGA